MGPRIVLEVIPHSCGVDSVIFLYFERVL